MHTLLARVLLCLHGYMDNITCGSVQIVTRMQSNENNNRGTINFWNAEASKACKQTFLNVTFAIKCHNSVKSCVRLKSLFYRENCHDIEILVCYFCGSAGLSLSSL